MLGIGSNVFIFISFVVLGFIIHELGHIFGLYLTYSKYTGFYFNSNEFAAVVKGKTYNIQSKVFVIILGSLSSIVLFMLVKLVLIHKKYAYMHLALNTVILNEILYWSYSAFIDYGDASSFLDIIIFDKILFGSFFLMLYVILFLFSMREFTMQIQEHYLKYIEILT